MKNLEVTLAGIQCEFTADGEPAEISGKMSARSISRDSLEHGSEEMFATETPVLIAPGETLSVGRTVRLGLLTSVDELTIFGEFLALGGELGIGGQRRLIIPSSEINNTVVDPGNPGAGMGSTETGRTYPLRFASEDGAQHVRADFVVKIAHFG
jgi:hypothetical protein